MADNEDERLTTIQKVTRSFSVKIGKSYEANSNRIGAKKSLPAPKKLDSESWIQADKQSLRNGTSGKIRPRSGTGNNVGDKASLWSKFAKGHQDKQSLNPFSETYDKEKLKSLICSKDDPNYGRPDKNSASAMRAAAGEAKMRADICDVCEVIFQNGQRSEDGCAAVQFGELFEIYNRINDKVVGLLIRAKKKSLLDFEGEMLYQGKDDKTWVILTKNINTIRVFFGREGDLPAGGEVDRDVMEQRIASKVAVEDCDAGAGKKNDSVVSTATANSLQVPCACDPETISILEAQSKPTDKRKTRLSNNNLKSSFRKLVKPIFKRSNSTKDLEPDCDSPALSRRGSRLSSKSGSSRCVDLQGEVAGTHGSKEEVHRRWRRVLSVSKAVGRFSLMVKKDNEETV